MRSYWVRKLEYNFSDHCELFKNFYIHNVTPLAGSTLTNFRFETGDIFFRDLALQTEADEKERRKNAQQLLIRALKKKVYLCAFSVAYTQSKTMPKRRFLKTHLSRC